MSGKTFLDTNVLVYLFDASAPAKRRRAREVVQREADTAVVSTQVLQELYVTVTRKLGRPLPEAEAEAAVRDLASFEVVATDPDLVLRAIARSRQDRLSLWDALVVEAALGSGCDRLLSEDLQDGHQYGPLRVENPFRSR